MAIKNKKKPTVASILKKSKKSRGKPTYRMVIASGKDGRWYTRRIKTVIGLDDRGLMIYECDKPLGGPFDSLMDIRLPRGLK